MNVNETQVSNAANFSLFMVTFSRLLLRQLQDMNIESMLDLKTVFRARKYTRRIIIEPCRSKATFDHPHPSPLPEGEGALCCFTSKPLYNSLGINAEQFLIDNRIFEAAEIGRIHARAA
jgi:hypothetical protein